MTFSTTARKLAFTLGFGAVVFFAASALAESILPVPQLLAQISQFEEQVEQQRLAAEQKNYGPDEPWSWEAEALPEATRSWLLFDLSEGTLDQIERNVDEKGEKLL